MSDLISREALITVMETKCDESKPLDVIIRNVSVAAIKKAPAVDAVEVVRCRECRWIANPFCPLYKHPTHSYDDFCSYGERKEVSE